MTRHKTFCREKTFCRDTHVLHTSHLQSAQWRSEHKYVVEFVDKYREHHRLSQVALHAAGQSSFVSSHWPLTLFCSQFPLVSWQRACWRHLPRWGLVGYLVRFTLLYFLSLCVCVWAYVYVCVQVCVCVLVLVCLRTRVAQDTLHRLSWRHVD